MNDLLETLIEIGLNEKEAEIYLTMLKIGANPVSTIAKRSHQNRSSCYSHLEKMMQKGFVKQIIQANISYFSASEPKFILEQLKIRHRQLENKAQEIKDMLLQFQGIQNSSQEKSKVFFYQGPAGIQNIMEDALEAKEIMRAYVSLDELMTLLPGYFPLYYKRRVRKGIRVKAIYPTSPESIKQTKRDPSELRESKFISSKYNFHLDILIYNNKLAITSIKERFGFVIESSEIAEAQKKIFDLVWNYLN